MIKEAPGAVRTTIPGVPAIPTMICFILISLSGFFFINNSGVSFGSSILGMLILLIGAIAVMGYLLNLPFLYYSFEGYTSMAFHTAIFFVLLGIGIIFSGGKETEK
jgi:FtsH-binding integral membrane protein